MSLREMGEASGGVDYAAVSAVIRRYEKALPTSHSLHREKTDAFDHGMNEMGGF